MTENELEKLKELSEKWDATAYDDVEDNWIDEIDELMELEDNWDGYGTAAPKEHIRHWVTHTIKELSKYKLKPKTIVPSAEGGIGIILQTKDKKYADIEILNNLTLSSGVDSNHWTNPKILGVVDISGTNKIVEEVAKHFINKIVEEVAKHLTEENNCPKCQGAGWVWWFELEDNAGHDSSELVIDDTKYTCDECSKGE